jgi:hypothetical protein
MMAGLACAERVTPFCGNLILKGFSTLLYPTHLEDKTIFWHAICNEDGSRVSFADPRVSLSPDMVPVMMDLRPEDVNQARHIVGWAAEVKNKVGKYALEQGISDSRTNC